MITKNTFTFSRSQPLLTRKLIMKNESVIKISLLLVSLSFLIVINGCSPLLGVIVGKENAKAMDLAMECKHEEALKITNEVRRSGSIDHRAVAAQLQATLLIEMGREKEAMSLYPEILASPLAKESGLTRVELDKQIRDTAAQSKCKQ